MRIIFMGTPLAAVPTLERLLADGHDVCAVWTQPDKPSGRGNKLHGSPIKEFALERGLTVFQPAKIKTPETLELFRSREADVIVVVAYGRILPPTFLESFEKGAINVHFSLLPKYRGAAPVNWAIVMGETKTGVTTMQMDPGLDTGDILLMRETEIGEDETTIQLMGRLSLIGADLLSDTLTRLDELTPQKQDNAQATLAPILKKEDGLIDWKMTAADINNRIRGFQPFPKSFTFHDGKRIVIWKAKTISDSDSAAPGGTIIEAKNDKLLIACGENTGLQILEAQAEGKKQMNVRDFLNGFELQVGEILG
jgi:methionyl-tRNA formyltransferase